MKVYIVGGDTLIQRMFYARGWDMAADPEEADLIQFTGGEDVSPMLYGEPRHPRTGNSLRRDEFEANIFHHYRDDKKMAGICRGGQFLCVMNGGRMFQDVDNHAIHGTHVALELSTGKAWNVTSTHHQMMRISGTTGKLLLAAQARATYKEDGWQDNIYEGVLDVESVLWTTYKMPHLSFQPHPEYVQPGEDTEELYFKLLKEELDLFTEEAKQKEEV